MTVIIVCDICGKVGQLPAEDWIKISQVSVDDEGQTLIEQGYHFCAWICAGVFVSSQVRLTDGVPPPMPD